jgi:pilus assembly protein Flp/PilA
MKRFIKAPDKERPGYMGKWRELIVRFLRGEDGPTAVEYAVMLALIIVVCLVAITALGTNANKTFSNVSLNVAAS